MSNRVVLVAVATGFNLLFEYSLRGLNSLERQPLLPFALVALYASLFVMQDDLIRRWRLADVHLILLAFVYGTVYQCLVSGAAFTGPTAFGLNWGILLFVNVVWWGLLQSVLALYLANRIESRDWSVRPLPWYGWGLALAVNLGVIGLFQQSDLIPAGRPVGYLMMCVVAGAAAWLLQRLRPWPPFDPAPEFQPRSVLDMVCTLSLLLFAFSAVFLRGGEVVAREASVVNVHAEIVVVAWTIIAGLCIVASRLFGGRPVPV
ncbi:MAG: hypothetical protein HZB53_11135 [Chloroflexi bacterium]|nr:hypothetical protein [Chloroflexota bacterium]